MCLASNAQNGLNCYFLAQPVCLRLPPFGLTIGSILCLTHHLSWNFFLFLNCTYLHFGNTFPVWDGFLCVLSNISPTLFFHDDCISSSIDIWFPLPLNEFLMYSHTHNNPNPQKPFLSNISGSFFSGAFTRVLVQRIWRAFCGGRAHWQINYSVRCSSRIDPNWHQCSESTMHRKSAFSLLSQAKFPKYIWQSLSTTILHKCQTGKIFRSEFSKNAYLS